MIHLASDSMQQGWMGRQLPRLFSESGLIDIVTNGMVLPSDYDSLEMVFDGLLQDAQVAGKVSGEELSRFWDLLVLSLHQQRFLGHVCFVVGGRKP